jgi:hypothetical protein
MQMHNCGKTKQNNGCYATPSYMVRDLFRSRTFKRLGECNSVWLLLFPPTTRSVTTSQSIMNGYLMFFKHSMKPKHNSSYLPVSSSRNQSIHLIYASEETGVDSIGSLEDLIDRPSPENAASMFVIEAAGHGLFFLWTARVRTTSTNNLDDALTISQDFIRKARKGWHLSVMFNGEHEKMANAGDCSILATLAKYDGALASSLGMPLVQREKIAEMRRSSKDGTWGTSLLVSLSFRFWCVLSVMACVLVVLALTVKHYVAGDPYNPFHSWIQYDTRGSNGPRYQLPLTSENASAWSSYINNDLGNWALRVDDQALIPLHLMDDEEKHYQEWFQARYPEVNQIRLNHNYISDTWLGSNATDEVPVDDMFHFSHCVMAVKRYIKAKETGRHVCGRDVNTEHMKHCLAALDWWAFSDGKRGDTVPNPKRPFGWRTKVCFD